MAQGDVDGDGTYEIVLGCEDSGIRLLNCRGVSLWEFQAGGRINSVAIADIDNDGKGEIIAGCSDRHCYVLNGDGTERWRYQCTKGNRQHQRYCKDGEVHKVLAADINGNGRREVISGAANRKIHACDSEGNLLWRFIQHGLCTSLVAADLNGDGTMEIAGGPSRMASTSRCNVINENGECVSFVWNDGWGSALTAICAADLDGNGRPEVICGTNQNSVYALSTTDLKLATRWKYTAGDVIHSLCAAKLGGSQAQHVIAGSGSEYAYALDGNGKVTWRVNLYEPVRHVAAGDLNSDGRDEIVASTSEVMYLLDSKGNIRGTFKTEAEIACVDLGEELILGTKALLGTSCAIGLGPEGP